LTTPLSEPALQRPEGHREADRLTAVLLAGGAGRRLGGADKARLRRDGSTLMQHWTEALAQRGVPTVVVGPESLRADLPVGTLLTREDPPLGGPAAAARAGVLALEEAGLLTERPGRVLLAAVDVVDPVPLLDWLWAHLDQAGQRAVIPQDGTGALQHLASLIPVCPLRARAREITAQEAEGRPLRILLEGIDALHPTLPEGLGADVDTPEDARRLHVHRPG